MVTLLRDGATPLGDGAALVSGLLKPKPGRVFKAKICCVLAAGAVACTSAATSSPNKALICSGSRPMAKAKSVKLFSLGAGCATVMISTSGLRAIDCKACPYWESNPLAVTAVSSTCSKLWFFCDASSSEWLALCVAVSACWLD